MTPVFHQDQDGGEATRCIFRLPTSDHDGWLLDVPASLERCIGRYARIPEYALDGHILTVTRLIRERPAS